MSFGSFAGILIGRPERFAISFTLGNIINIIGYEIIFIFTNND